MRYTVYMYMDVNVIRFSRDGCTSKLRMYTHVRMLHNKPQNVNTKRLPISIDKGLHIIPNDYMALSARRTQ